MDAKSGPPPFNLFGERLAEIIKKAVKQQMAQSDQKNPLSPKLEQMVEQQQQTNAQLSHLLTAISQLNERIERSASRRNAEPRNAEPRNAEPRNAEPPFWKKMALEVPPVVLAVLLAFGINSWWQQRQRAQVAANSKANITREVKRNLATVENNYEGNKRNIVMMKELIQQAKASPDSLIQGTGVKVFPLTDAAWQSSYLTGAIRDLDHSFIQDAATIYGLQEDIKAELYGTLSALTGIDTYQPENTISSLMIETDLIKEYIGDSELIMRYYREFLEKYGDEMSTTSDQPPAN